MLADRHIMSGSVLCHPPPCHPVSSCSKSSVGRHNGPKTCMSCARERPSCADILFEPWAAYVVGRRLLCVVMSRSLHSLGISSSGSGYLSARALIASSRCTQELQVSLLHASTRRSGDPEKNALTSELTGNLVTGQVLSGAPRLPRDVVDCLGVLLPPELLRMGWGGHEDTSSNESFPSSQRSVLVHHSCLWFRGAASQELQETKAIASRT